jgi:hypothetical protein
MLRMMAAMGGPRTVLAADRESRAKAERGQKPQSFTINKRAQDMAMRLDAVSSLGPRCADLCRPAAPCAAPGWQPAKCVCVPVSPQAKFRLGNTPLRGACPAAAAGLSLKPLGEILLIGDWGPTVCVCVCVCGVGGGGGGVRVRRSMREAQQQAMKQQVYAPQLGWSVTPQEWAEQEMAKTAESQRQEAEATHAQEVEGVRGVPLLPTRCFCGRRLPAAATPRAAPRRDDRPRAELDLRIWPPRLRAYPRWV